MVKKKVIWLVVSVLMVLSLVIASCGPGEEEAKVTEEGGQTITTKEEAKEEEEEEEEQPSTVEPQYGGTLSVVYGLDIMGFDELTAPDYWDVAGHLTHDELLEGDWAQGPEGTGKFSWRTNDVYRWDSKSGALAESFEIVEPGHFIFHIRQGVHFGLNSASEASRLVNGREMTGDDVYWNINRWLYGEGSQVARSARTLVETIEITQPDKWTIDIKVPIEQTIYVASYIVDWCSVYPPEVIDKYGSMNDWQNSVGTGPFFITDYVRGSVVKFERNPNYWQTDPVDPGKGNQLPYLDGVKYLIITDASTTQAAVRTGQIDVQGGFSLDDLAELQKTAPDLVVAQNYPAAVGSMAMHLDKPELPFSNKSVRQALSMAIDYDTIIEQLYQGKAQLPSFPITPEPELKGAYLSFDDPACPEAVKELFTYNPDKAKQLLTEAGYPNGFKTKIVCTSPAVDYLSIIKDYWAQLGVDLTIEAVETGAWNSFWATRTYDEIFWWLQASSGTYVRMLNLDGTGVGQNMSYLNDQKVKDTKAKMIEAFASGNDAEVDRLHKELMPYVLEQAWVIQSPVPYANTVWWPWLRGFQGEYSPGVCNEFRWAKYVWIDQALKRSMGY